MKNTRKKSFAVLAGLAITGIVGASAATLNGITSSLGAESAVVGSCDPDGVDVDYDVAYVPASGIFDVEQINVSDIELPGCNGLTWELVLTGASGVLYTAPGGTIGGATITINTSATTIDATLVTGIAMSIS